MERLLSYKKGTPISFWTVWICRILGQSSQGRTHKVNMVIQMCVHIVCLGQCVCLVWQGVCPELMNTT